MTGFVRLEVFVDRVSYSKASVYNREREKKVVRM